METSIFMDLTNQPTNDELKQALLTSYSIWVEIRDFVFQNYPKAFEEWHVSAKKYGWGFRIKDKKRAIIYLSPRSGYFKVAMVFGQKAFDKILIDEISQFVKNELINSKVYPEGRVIRLDIYDSSYIQDIKKLVQIKLAK